jgi:integrase
MASIYAHRDGWQASVCVQGKRKKKNFASVSAAKTWARKVESELDQAHEPGLGGPSNVTLAGMLMKYAHQFTLVKKGCATELPRINRYLLAGGLPTLRQELTDNGGTKLVEITASTDKELPSAFSAKLKQRKDKRKKTNVLRAKLACTVASAISKDMLRDFMAQMHSDGLSGSTALKEMALLKHCFNMAIKEWSWVDFKNPLVGMNLPKPAPSRDRVFAADEEGRLRAALAQCENPYILPLFEFALETTARRGSLFKLQWRDIDYERRYALLHDTKGGHNVPVPLTQRAIDILKRLPREPGQTKVFPITINALKMAWERACERADIEDLHFHDTRHVGTTQHAKRLGSLHMLMKITGHKTTTQLQIYTHISSNDVLKELDATEATTMSKPLPLDNSQTTMSTIVAKHKGNHLNAGRKKKAMPVDVIQEVTQALPSNVFVFQAKKKVNASSASINEGEPSPTSSNQVRPLPR